MCFKLFFVDLISTVRKLEFDGVENEAEQEIEADDTKPVTMECEESSDAITEIRPLGRPPFSRQAR